MYIRTVNENMQKQTHIICCCESSVNSKNSDLFTNIFVCTYIVLYFEFCFSLYISSLLLKQLASSYMFAEYELGILELSVSSDSQFKLLEVD